MNKKILLTSVIALSFACPAMAAPTPADFPSTGLMQEDKSYTGAANHDNMGVYEGSVTANAQYDWDMITVEAGKYLPANATEVADCPAGSYCEGEDEQVHWDGTSPQGITGSCATFSDEFTLSDAGAASSAECYRACTTDDVDNSAAVSGKNYSGITDTCVATECASGYDVNNGVCVGKTITITWVGATTANITANNAGSCTYGGDINTPVKAVDLPGRTFRGWKFHKTEEDVNVNANDLGTYIINGNLQEAGYGIGGNYSNADDQPTSNSTPEQGGGE